MKYVIFERGGMETVRVFDEITDHCDVVQEVQGHRPGLKVVSAGKLSFRQDEEVGTQCRCTSGSTTLGIKFNDQQSDDDEKIINLFLRQ